MLARTRNDACVRETFPASQCPQFYLRERNVLKDQQKRKTRQPLCVPVAVEAEVEVEEIPALPQVRTSLPSRAPPATLRKRERSLSQCSSVLRDLALMVCCIIDSPTEETTMDNLSRMAQGQSPDAASDILLTNPDSTH